jgi:predicted transcriptional regulator
MKAEVTPVLSKQSAANIVQILQEGASTPKAIAGRLGFTQAHVSNRLALLKAHGIVQATKHGRFNIYRLSDEVITRIEDSPTQ